MKHRRVAARDKKYHPLREIKISPASRKREIKNITRCAEAQDKIYHPLRGSALGMQHLVAIMLALRGGH